MGIAKATCPSISTHDVGLINPRAEYLLIIPGALESHNVHEPTILINTGVTSLTIVECSWGSSSLHYLILPKAY